MKLHQAIEYVKANRAEGLTVREIPDQVRDGLQYCLVLITANEISLCWEATMRWYGFSAGDGITTDWLDMPVLFQLEPMSADFDLDEIERAERLMEGL